MIHWILEVTYQPLLVHSTRTVDYIQIFDTEINITPVNFEQIDCLCLVLTIPLSNLLLVVLLMFYFINNFPIFTDSPHDSMEYKVATCCQTSFDTTKHKNSMSSRARVKLQCKLFNTFVYLEHGGFLLLGQNILTYHSP